MYVNINKTEESVFAIEPININKILFQPEMQRPYGKNYHQFIWVTDGMGVFVANGQKKFLSKGQGLFSRQGCPHSYYAVGDVFSTRWVTFVGGDVILDYFNIEDYMFFDVPDFLDKSTDKLGALCSSSNDIMRSAHTYTWLCEFLNAYFSKNITFAKKVELYLEQNYSSNKSLDEIARELGTDKYALCHKFAKQTGTTVVCALKKIRIEKAKVMLQSSFTSIEEVGKKCGYESPSYFAKLFKEETGVTPNQYRAKQNANYQ